MTDDRYVPPEQPGYVFYSNFSMIFEDARSVSARVREVLPGLSAEDVRVIEFVPDGLETPDSTRWASYVVAEKGACVAAFHAEMDVLGRISEALNGGAERPTIPDDWVWNIER